jgi:hypothetical protein
MIARLIDSAFGSQRLSYRRLLCWLTCTALVPFGFVSGEDYILICTVYVGSDAAQKAVSAWKS